MFTHSAHTAQQYTVVEGSTSDCLQTLSPNPSVPPVPSSSGRPAGWIAGVALASVGGALILLALSWFAIAFLRRRRAQTGTIYLLPASRSQGSEQGGEPGAAGSGTLPISAVLHQLGSCLPSFCVCDTGARETPAQVPDCQRSSIHALHGGRAAG